jgi:uncharacterized protein (TIGR03437 family)
MVRAGSQNICVIKVLVLALLLLSTSAFGSNLPTPITWFQPITRSGSAQFSYLARLKKYSVLVAGSEISVQFPAALSRSAEAIGITFLGSNQPAVLADQRLSAFVNDLSGTDPRSWRRNIPAFSSLRVPALYPGIDVLYRGLSSAIEYDFLVSPGADPRRIRIQFHGADQVVIQQDGTLTVSSPGGEVRQSRPVAYQEWSGARQPVEAVYVWRNGAIGIQTGPYNRTKQLVIDPVVVAYVGVFGGSIQDEGDAITTDGSGGVYIAGSTESPDFPITPGAAIPSPSGAVNGFVTKLAANGAKIIYSTYINGTANGIAVDQTGSAYVIASAYIGQHAGLADGIQVTKLSPSGDTIVYQTSLPGPGSGLGIAVDAQGAAYITGSTAASNFPVTAGAFQTQLLGTDAFIAKLDPNGKLVYATFLGGSGDEEGRSIAVDSAGNAYVTGVIHNSTDFPVVNAAQPTPGGAFVYRSDDDGASWKPAGNGITAPVGLLAVDPTDGSVVYAALEAGGLVKTTDAGASWIPAGQGLGMLGLTSLAFDLMNPSTLYAADGSTLYKSVDGGMNWSDLGAGTPLIQTGNGGPTLVAVDAMNPDLIYAFRDWIGKSTDGGRTWQVSLNIPGFGYDIDQAAVDPKTSAVYIAGPGAFFKSLNGGAAWISLFSGVSYFALAPAGTLYVDNGVNTFQSNDAGATWAVVGLPPQEYVPRLAADPTNTGVIYSWAGTGNYAGGSFVPGELYKHSGAANLWQTASQMLSGEAALITGDSNYITAFAAAPSAPNRLYYAASPGWDAFVAKINPTGTQLLYSTYLGGISNDYGNAIAIDAAGNAYVAGATASINFPVTASGFQKTFAGGAIPYRDPRVSVAITDYPRGTDAFIAKLDPTGSHIVYASYLGGKSNDWALALAVDLNGNALVSGYTMDCTSFPTVADGFPPQQISAPSYSFLSQVAPDGSQLTYSTCFGGTGGAVATSIVLDPKGNAYLTGLGNMNMVFTPNAGTVGSALFLELQFPAAPPPSIRSGGVVDAFTYYAGDTSPGSLISIFGTGFASLPTSAQLVPIPLTLGGVSVTIDGIAAPVFYANSAQINVQVPWAVKPGTTNVVVSTAVGSSVPAPLLVQAAAPVIAYDFNTGHAIAINQDQTMNSASNPAPVNSVITLYLTGQGPVSNTPATGAPAPAKPLAQATSSAYVSMGPNPQEMIYSPDLLFLGLAPGLVGLAQADVRIPNLPAGDYDLTLTIGVAGSNFVTVSVGPHQ